MLCDLAGACFAACSAVWVVSMEALSTCTRQNAPKLIAGSNQSESTLLIKFIEVIGGATSSEDPIQSDRCLCLQLASILCVFRNLVLFRCGITFHSFVCHTES